MTVDIFSLLICDLPDGRTEELRHSVGLSSSQEKTRKWSDRPAPADSAAPCMCGEGEWRGTADST